MTILKTKKILLGAIVSFGILGVVTVQAQSVPPPGDNTQTVLSSVDRDQFLTPSHKLFSLEGVSLRAFDVAWKAVLKRKRLPKKLEPDLQNFTVTFNEDEENLYVHLVPHVSYTIQKDGGIRYEMGGGNKFGEELRYTVARKSMKITRVQTYY